MRLDLRDLQFAYDARWPFPMWLLRRAESHRQVARYWTSYEPPSEEDYVEVLAYAEVAEK